jgi:uncharacterized protein (TIGR00661 family)
LKTGRLRIVYLIQGEGRGHLTQALSLKRVLEDAGHEVVAAFVGENPARPLPDFFLRRLDAPTHVYLPPLFVMDARRKGVKLGASFVSSVKQIPHYWTQGSWFHEKFSAYAPDLVVNFYEMLGGVYQLLSRSRVPNVAIGHQFLFFHPQLPTPRDAAFQVMMARAHARFTALNADLRLGLSFTPLPSLRNSRVRIVPPLLRDGVLNACSAAENHLLAYVLNPGYGTELERWHNDNRDVVLHCFWDKKDAPNPYSPHENLTFHRIDDRKFIDLLSSCRGFTGTAGFESVCEAAFLGKPILVVPTANHIEQRCNALDAERAGLAIWKDNFDLTDFVKGLDEGVSSSQEEFRRWVLSAPETFVRLLEGLCSGMDPLNIPLESDRIPLRDRGAA